MGFILGLAGNVAANVIFWALLGIIFWAVSATVARRFSRFFGLSRANSMAVFQHELWAAQAVDRLFSSAPLRPPGLVRGLVDALWLRQRIRCTVEVSPPKGEDADLDRNLIVVGSSARNSVRARYVHARLPTAILTGEDQAPVDWPAVERARTVTITRSGSESRINLADVNIAFVEKCYDPDRGTTVFFCVGIRGDSSWGCDGVPRPELEALRCGIRQRRLRRVPRIPAD